MAATGQPCGGSTVAKTENGNFGAPDETRTFERGRLDLAWVIGDEPVVLIDWSGASNYAKT
jgi:hypothetical protein